MRPRYRAAARTAAAMTLVGGLAGCAMLDDDPAGASSKDGRPSVDTTGDPVVKATFDSPTARGAKVDIAVMDLRSRGTLATLSVRFTPHVPGTTRTVSPYNLNGNEGLDTALIDPVNLKRYVVVKDSGGKELQTNEISTQIANEQAALLSFTFASPPKDVKAVDIQIGSWPTFRSIPVQR